MLSSCRRLGAYGAKVVVVAGKGNNGNDGRVAARLLADRGARVRLLATSESQPDIAGADLVVDAAFGTGFRGEYAAPATSAPVLAVDVPSGLDADLGVAGPQAVRADRTVTFGALKAGLLLNDGPLHSGGVVVAGLGLAVGEAAPRTWLVESADVAGHLPMRGLHDHKWLSAVMVVAGSPGMYGAPQYVADGAGRAGSGMVRLGVPGAPLAALPSRNAVGVSLEKSAWDAEALEAALRCRALVVGPGLGLAAATRQSVTRLVAASQVPTVVDADGLTALGDAATAAEVIGRRSGAPVVLTPHEGEFQKLAGAKVGPDRIGATRALAAQVGCVVLLKGATTVVADQSGRALLVTSGSAQLATAGSGDVLSGVIGALLARGLPALEAAAYGAHVHGLAGELGHSQGLLAGDLPELVATVLSQLATGRG
jgi:NAD(P)H-hydrate epimerase